MGVPEFLLSSWDHNDKQTVYILKPKPDHGQLVFANYCIFLTCLAFWISGVYNNRTIKTGAGKFEVTEKQKSFNLLR